MVTERADLSITPGLEAEFEKDMVHGVALLAGASGAESVSLMRCVERPSRYMLQIEWQSLADHQAFTKTEQFTQFVALIAKFFAERPSTEHFQPVSA